MKPMDDRCKNDDAQIENRIENVLRYDQELNRMQIAPNGDDYNAILDMLGGAPYRQPHREGR